MNTTLTAPLPAATRASRIERIVLGFVLVALALLVTVPTLVNRRVNALRESIESSEYARSQVTNLEFNLVLEMAALSEAMLTRDTAAVSDYAAAVGAENSIYQRLEPHARALGPEVYAQFQQVREQSAIWHARAADAEDLLQEYGDATQPRPRRERLIFEEVLATTRQLDRAILERTNAVRREIEAAERLGLSVTVGLGLLALIAGGAATLLAGRARRFADESERRRDEAEIALENLAHEADLRHRLLQGITHDVKNPLGTARGFAELLAMGVKTPILPEQVPLVEGVMRSVDSALSIITDLLDVARAESGGLTIAPVDVELGRVVRETVEDHRAAAEAAGHTLRFRRPEREVLVHTDPARVRQVLQNLISNALKYTPSPGTVTVDVGVRSSGPGTEHGAWTAFVRVNDTGPGIPPGMRERVFDEFTRLAGRGEVQGHGLGLAIARRIARLLGGDLCAEEPDERGASFVLSLPLPSRHQSRGPTNSLPLQVSRADGG